MYSKKEVCFTIILALTASGYLISQQAEGQTVVQGSVSTIADGTHPPPPVPPAARSVEGGVALQADGTHPPPPVPPAPQLIESGVVLQADGTHPPPPVPPRSSTSQVG